MINTEEYKKHIYDVVGAIHEVHKELGAGLNEYCYQEGLQMQLEESGIPFKRELSFHPYYHGKEMSAEYRVDFLCKDDIVVECKSVAELISNHRAQLFNYMRITKQKRGILMNFGGRSFASERYWYQEEEDDFVLLKESNFRDYVNMSSK